jgi:hypothetical protein
MGTAGVGLKPGIRASSRDVGVTDWVGTDGCETPDVPAGVAEGVVAAETSVNCSFETLELITGYPVESGGATAVRIVNTPAPSFFSYFTTAMPSYFPPCPMRRLPVRPEDGAAAGANALNSMLITLSSLTGKDCSAIFPPVTRRMENSPAGEPPEKESTQTSGKLFPPAISIESENIKGEVRQKIIIRIQVTYILISKPHFL